ncbi:hypothetical protein PINS_up003945 [Pythium insidiosum]|nr:hypothetical protein PINS_up003945 [Pythium insidiosum]
MSDCTEALSLLPDTGESPGKQAMSALKGYRLKLKLLVRRGTALCRLGKFMEAKADYGVALTMDGQNDALKEDYYQLVLLEKAEESKRLGDECFQRNELDDAVTHYSESLRLNPQSIACLSNRAATYLRRHDHQRCIEDCTQALTLLQQAPGADSEASQRKLTFFAAGPAPGTAKRREWVVKTMVRRGTAFLAMDRLDRGE